MGVGQESGIGALDHVAIPIQNVEEMVSFYRALGFGVRENGRIISIHFYLQQKRFSHRHFLLVHLRLNTYGFSGSING